MTGPGPLLVGTAGKPVELTVSPSGGGDPRHAVVVPVDDEEPLRYHAWVADRRAYVHERSGGRLGYLHVPDMQAPGWAQIHRDLRVEVAREGLVVDVRENRGGHTSQLVVEKLARRVVGWDLPRGSRPFSYPQDAPRGPVVAVANEFSGSDGDIVNAAIRALGIGPVVGTRTWGGVIGIDSRYHLVDGTLVTQPKYAFWTEGEEWGVENHGVDPDVEVVMTPDDYAAGRDPQLDEAVRIALAALAENPAKSAPPLPWAAVRPGIPPRRATRRDSIPCVPITAPEEAGPMAGEARSDCLFCKIVAGEVPATVVRETETTLAFRDINPQAPTHVLIIPKVHHPDAASLAAAEPQIAADVLREAQEVATEEKAESYRIVFNTGAGAGQTVFHAHAHVLGGRGLQWPPG